MTSTHIHLDETKPLTKKTFKKIPSREESHEKYIEKETK